MYTQKRDGVKAVKDQLREDNTRKKQFDDLDIASKAEKREQIRGMVDQSKQNVAAFKNLKAMQTKAEAKEKIEGEKRMIYQFEKEAQSLEQEEEELIQILQQLQIDEKAAFEELENAMITASLAKQLPDRAGRVMHK